MAPERWEGIRNATEYGNNCLQYDRMKKKVIGSEDCLFLNIFRPVVKKRNEVFRNFEPIFEDKM
jgi:carboxylesterase type B